jgi:hypothetical protein
MTSNKVTYRQRLKGKERILGDRTKNLYDMNRQSGQLEMLAQAEIAVLLQDAFDTRSWSQPL